MIILEAAAAEETQDPDYHQALFFTSFVQNLKQYKALIKLYFMLYALA